MKYSKNGLSTLFKYLLLSTFNWSIVEAFSIDISGGLFVITSVLSIILWHEGIKKGMEQSIKEGIVIALYFIIPYGVSILISWDFLFYDGFDLFRFPIYMVNLLLNYPMTILPQQHARVLYKYFSIVEPFLIIVLIVIINIIIKNLKLIKGKLRINRA
jgi:hypothetical protein